MRSHAATSSDRDLRHRIAWTLVAGFLAGGIVAAFAATAAGQQPQYEVMEFQEDLKAGFQEDRNVRRMKAAWRGYYPSRDPAGFKERNIAIMFAQKYVPPRITDPKATSEISELTRLLIDGLKTAQRAGNPDAGRIAGLVYGGMKPVAFGNYHPPARIAATLVLAQLDGGSAAANQPPRISAAIVTDLFNLYRDENNDDGIRAAALQGLHRQVRYAANNVLTAELRNGIASEMTKLLDSESPIHRSPEAHAYLQRFAVDLLTVLRGPGDKDLATKLVSISTAADKPDLIALHSAAHVGRMKDALTGNLNTPGVVLDKWSARLLRAFQSELARLQSFDPPTAARDQPPAPRDVLQSAAAARPRSMEGGGYEGALEDEMGGYEGGLDEEMYGGEGPGAFGATEAKPQPPEVLASRRHLNHVLQQVHLAVTGSPKTGTPAQPGGLLAAVDPADRPLVENWVRRMEGVVTAMNDEFLEDRKKFVEAIQGQLLVLEELAGDQANPQDAAPQGAVDDELATDAEPADTEAQGDLDRLPVTAIE